MTITLAAKPDFDQAIQRIEAWYAHEVIDRPPVRFSGHNVEYGQVEPDAAGRWPTLKERWFDVDYQLERFLRQIEGKSFLGETFPIFWPNLGPNVLAGIYGCPLEFGEVTSWAEPILTTWGQPVTLNWESEYLRQLETMTQAALAVCTDRFLVGYTDFHPGLDWLAALRDTQRLCIDMVDEPEELLPYLESVSSGFLQIFDHFDTILKAHGQPSVTWMGIPFFGRMHIPSCDFAALIAPRHFKAFAMPALEQEVRAMTHNIFHVDGKGVAVHLDAILELPNVGALQWVQGAGNGQPILQWVPLIRRMLAAGKSVVVDLKPAELEAFIDAMDPEGLLLCMEAADEDEERAILKRLERW